MKHFFLFSFLLLTGFLNAAEEDEPFKIDGQVDDASIENFVFRYYRCKNDSSIIDTIPVINGAFRIEGIVSPLARAIFDIKGKEVFFYLDAGEMQLYLKTDSLESSVLRGSKSQTDREALESLTKPLEYDLSKIETQLASEQNEQNKNFLISRKDSIHNLLKDMKIDFITSHPDSYYSIDLIHKLLHEKKQNADTLMSLFEGLSENVRTSCTGQQRYGSILQRQQSFLTNVYPLEALDKEGAIVKLSDFKGKYIFIDFWASWCVPCIKEFPYLKELYAKYKDKGLVIIGISIDRKRDKQNWLNAIEKHNLTEWIHLLSCENMGRNNICNLHDMLQDASIPHCILIDKSGNIVKQWRGFGEAIVIEQHEMFENIFEDKK